MYVVLATRLAVTQGTDQFSAAIPMTNANSSRVGATVLNLGGATNIAITLQGSLDGANWETIGSALTMTTATASSLENKNYTFPWVRLKYSVTGAATTVIVATDINTSMQ